MASDITKLPLNQYYVPKPQELDNINSLMFMNNIEPDNKPATKSKSNPIKLTHIVYTCLTLTILFFILNKLLHKHKYILYPFLFIICFSILYYIKLSCS
jgi:hypothetical protein